MAVLISDEDIERVRQASDLVQIASEHVTLKRSGRKFKACCPFHNEKTPSFQIDPELNLWHCFGCGEGGDVFDFVQRVENIDFPDAVRLLADRAHIDIVEQGGKDVGARGGRKERIRDCCDEAAVFYHFQLMRSASADAAAARDYLSSRGFGSAVCKRWQLGFAPGRGVLIGHLTKKGFTRQEIVDANLALEDANGNVRDRFFNRVMFPIHDKGGRTIAFGGRVIGKGEPKYLNSSETVLFHKSANLYGIDHAKEAITNNACAVVVEGYTDVIAMHEAGVKNVVATLGTALTPTHVKMLRSMRPKKIIYLFDGDSAGQKAADRASEFIDWGITPEAGRDYIDFLVTVLPNDQDPAEFVASAGKAGMEKALASAVPLIRFAIERRLDSWDLTRPEERASAIASAVGLLVPIKGSIVASDYVNYIADRLGCETVTVQRALETTQVRATPAAKTDTPSTDATREEPQKESDVERMERECLSLVIRFPETVPTLIAEAGQKLWTNGMAEAIAGTLSTEYRSGMTAQQLVSTVDEKSKGAAAYLSAGTIECDDSAQANGIVLALIGDLKENGMLQQIRLGNARLKRPEQMTSEEYDALFERISALQKELNNLRAAREAQSRI